MKYNVVWTGPAEQELSALWMAAPNRAAVTAASSEIDRLLATDPDQRGVVCFDTVRTLNVPPLGVDFEAIEADHVIYVLTVWDLAQGKPNGQAP
jgi:hypothetical protein